MSKQDIMKLADEYASTCADVREFLGANAGWDEADGTWIASKQARAVLQSAIEALQAEDEWLKADYLRQLDEVSNRNYELRKESETLRAQLEAMQRQEPVGFVAPHDLKPLGEGYPINLVRLAVAKRTLPLYASPKALEPLTRPQINQMMANVGWQNSAIRHADLDKVEKVVRAVEAAHGIGSQQ